MAKKAKKGFKKDTFTIDAEIFASGKWNGMIFKSADLKEIVAAFEKLKDQHRVPLKFGHNDEQQMTDGHPALGWVDQVWVKTVGGIDKLFARFTDVPKIVYDAIKSKRYRNVSIELDFDVVHMSTHYPFVLSGVALLGADIPAVNVLADLTTYLNRDGALSYSRREVFTADPKSTKEGNIMDITQEEYDRLKKAEKERADFERQAKDEQAKREEFERKEKERLENEEREQVKTKRSEFTKMLDDGVTAMTITPAQKEVFAKVLKIDDDTAVLDLKREDVEALIGKPDKDDKGKKFERETAGGGAVGNTDHEDLEGKTAGEKLDFAARRLRGKDPKLSYSRAIESAMNAYPDLAREHIQATYTETKEG